MRNLFGINFEEQRNESQVRHSLTAYNFYPPKKGELFMANEGKGQGNMGQQRQQGQQAPARNPQSDQSTREKTGGHERKGTQYESDVERNRQDKGNKKGGQNEQARR
jgi:hypothetical protein